MSRKPSPVLFCWSYRSCPDDKTIRDAAQLAIKRMLSEELGPTDSDNLGRDS